MGPRNRRRLTPLGILTAFAVVLTACAEDDAGDETGDAEGPFYEGKTIELLVPSSPGGGADATAQFIAPRLSDHIPGNPDVEVIHEPAASGIAGVNEYALRREHDGETVLLQTLSSATAFILGEEAVEYDMGEFETIAAFPYSGVVYVSTKTGVTTAADLRDTDAKLIKGGRAPTASDIMHILALEVLGVRKNIQEIWGYEGTGDQVLAFEQGETTIDATTNVVWARSQHLVDEGLATPLVAYGFPDGEGGFTRDDIASDVPTVDEVYEEMYDAKPSGAEWEAFRTVMDVISVAHSLVVHEDAPPEAIDALREGFAAAVAEADFDKAMDEAVGPYDPIFEPEDIERAQEPLRSFDEQTSTWIRDFLTQEYPDSMS